ncbi:AsmA family protein [Mucilaginibacter glaciei]|uniref:AsmA family protein n=1 Tax=Mucilaginibacter glaciei TaxID=2772109 RepID=A0A926NQ19_9SPHI|nr:AsmA family protein [Mucilaginibacter glaciei]MBD1392570.1 AsmA family protein [Mucilaginibacter glaciei]
MPNWLKISLKVLAGLVLLVVLVVVGLSLYVTFNKAKVLKMVNDQLSKSVDGTLVIGDMHPTFFKGFPDVSLSLTDVLIRDKQFARHKHTLLNAKELNVSVNTAALFRGTIDVNHIEIKNAAVDLYTDTSGYSNTSVFKKDNKKVKNNPSESNSSTQLKKFTLENVDFTLNDQKAHKLFSFGVNDLRGHMSYPDSGWRSDFHLDVMAKSMAFNSLRGSFIKNKRLVGDFKAGFNESTGKINVQATPLNIGDDPFDINAIFETAKSPTNFSIHVAADKLLWRNAGNLLAPNINLALKRFNLSKPIAVTANISGSFGGGSDPLLYVTAKTQGNTLSIPGSTIENCNFEGIFTNSYVKSKPLGDENSVIKLIGLSGTYNHLPFKIDTGSIINLVKPIATGNFRSNFPAADLNYLLQDNVAKFTNGEADINLRYRADIVDYKINKPLVQGAINFRDADINYFPRKLLLKKTSFAINFVKNDLILSNIRLQSGRSVVLMNGRVNNFLNLYYDAPEKILLSWQIKSPQLYLAEFIGFLSARNTTPTKTGTTNSGNIIDQLSNVLQRGKAEMHMEVDNLHYKKFLATDTRADLLTTDDGIILKDISLKTTGGSVRMNGKLTQGKSLNNFAVNSVISSVNVRDFFYAFDNFGLTDFTAENLKGYLSAKANITGGITDAGSLAPQSINGRLDLNLKNAALLNFKPITGVGKFAFPFRDLKNIAIPSLDAHFDVRGDKIIINPLEFSSSVINMDVAGVYGLTKGTDIALDIPLRDPSKDKEITDDAELKKRRFKGIVVHIRAHEEGGKMKIGWNSNHK